MKVDSPDRGTQYSVTRRWLPWRRRLRGGGPDVPDVSGALSVGADDPLSALLFLVVLVVVAVLFVPAVLLTIGVVLELALLLALLPLAVLVRVAFGAPWEVEVRRVTGGVWPVVHTEQVTGWRASGRRIAEVADEIRTGTRRPLDPHRPGPGPTGTA